MVRWPAGALPAALSLSPCGLLLRVGQQQARRGRLEGPLPFHILPRELRGRPVRRRWRLSGLAGAAVELALHVLQLGGGGVDVAGQHGHALALLLQL